MGADVMLPVFAFGVSMALAARGIARRVGERASALVGGGRPQGAAGRRHRKLDVALELERVPVRMAASLAAVWLGYRVAGWPAAAMGAGAGATVPLLLRRRRRRRREDLVESQLAELADASSLALRGGSSTAQALEIASDELDEPLSSIVRSAVRRRALGTSFDRSLDWLVATIGTEDARLFGLVLGAHHRSGGNVSGALEEVAATIRHRIGVRHELRALTAQGRISGAILGALPIGFFLVMAVTSHRELGPVYRSPAGAAMVVTGLVFEVLAYLWIRHLLKVAL